MPGDAALGAVLRELRTARKLTLAAVARQAGCAESLISYVENGRRQLHPWLAERLDAIYLTGGAVAALLRGAGSGRHDNTIVGCPANDVLFVQSPAGGASVPISRREVLTGLGIGVLGGLLNERLEQVVSKLDRGEDPLQSLGRAFDGFRTAARVLPPARLLDSMIGHVVLIDVLRRRAGGHERKRFAAVQSRFAESLSWLSEEAGDARGAS